MPKVAGQLSGKYSVSKNQRLHRAESTLERDFILLLEKDATVEKYIEQPLRIKYTDAGKVKHYVPDVLVVHLDNPSVAGTTPPLLCEIHRAMGFSAPAALALRTGALAHLIFKADGLAIVPLQVGKDFFLNRFSPATSFFTWVGRPVFFLMPCVLK